MKTFRIREVLTKLYDAQEMSGTINAVLQKTKTLIIGSDQLGDIQSQETTSAYRVHQLEAEHLKAKAEELAQKLRQRIV